MSSLYLFFSPQAYQRLYWKRRRYAWLTLGWFQDSWWKIGASSKQTNCTDANILDFLWKQRVVGVSPALDDVINTTYNIVSIELHSEN